MRRTLYIERRDAVSGSRYHGAIYPMFSRLAFDAADDDGENLSTRIYRKITIEDGKFDVANRRIGYTGQHTTIYGAPSSGIWENCPPYVEGELYSRNKYGATRRYFRLDVDRAKLQFKRAGKWYDFTPSNYVD